MNEQMTDKERSAFCQKTSTYVMEALDTAWHDGMKIGREHQKGFQDRIAELEESSKKAIEYANNRKILIENMQKHIGTLTIRNTELETLLKEGK